MATEVGGIVIGIDYDVTDILGINRIDEFFKDLESGLTAGTPGPLPGITDHGSFLLFGDEYEQETISLQNLGNNAVVQGGAGSKGIFAGSGDNHILVLNDQDRLIQTGSGDDKVVLVGDGNSKIDTGSGNDTVIVTGSGDNQIRTGSGDDTIIVEGSGNSDIQAGSGNDVVNGGRGDDTIDGGSGDDILHGGDGDDVIDGGSGNDFIEGGLGDDALTGSSGQDTFFFGNETTGHDTVKDFSVQDVLQIADRTGDGKVTDGEDYTIEQVGQDTVVTLKGGDQVVLKNVDKSKLADNGEDDGIFTLH